MSSNIDKIKEALGIVDVVGGYIKLEKAGENFKAKCPFHNEKTPSFFVSPGRGGFYCFGCGVKGDIFTFVQEFEGMDFYSALKSLSLRAGVPLQFEDKAEKTEKEKLFEILEVATCFFEENLKNNNKALDYLSKRGVKDKTVKDWRLGFAPPEWRSLVNHLLKLGFDKSELIKSGLAKKSQKDDGSYDVFRGRIIFPIFDDLSRPIAFSGRILVEEENSPKYLNSPETPLFDKSKILYGFEKAKTNIRKKNYSILVEGQMDLILSHQEGFDNTVASSGTALTLFQLNKLKRFSSRIILAYDGDGAGFKAVKKSTREALSLDMNVKIADLPKSEDPASIIMKDRDKWVEILKKSLHIIDFQLEKILSSNLPKRQMDHEIRVKILPFIKLIPSKIDQARFVADISEKAVIKEEAVWNDLKNIPEGPEEEERGDISHKQTEQPSLTRLSNILDKLTGIIFWQESSKHPVIQTDSFKGRLLEKHPDQGIFEKSESEKSELIFKAEAYFFGKGDLENIFSDLLLNLEEEILKEEFSEKMKELVIMEKKDKKLAEEMLEQCGKISKKINELNVKRSQKFF